MRISFKACNLFLCKVIMISMGPVTFKHIFKCFARPGPHNNIDFFFIYHNKWEKWDLIKSVPENHNKFKENLFKIYCPQKDWNRNIKIDFEMLFLVYSWPFRTLNYHISKNPKAQKEVQDDWGFLYALPFPKPVICT